MDNHGGRVSYKVGEEVVIMNSDCTLSNHLYKVAEPRSDRHGAVGLLHPVSKTIVRVHNRRIMTPEVAEKIIVIEVSDKYFAVCGKCGHREAYSDEIKDYICPECGNKNGYHWISDRPQAQIAKPQPKKPKKVPVKVDMKSLIQLPNCELWSRKMVFDHPEIDARTNVLICLDGQPRKLVFNTYDGKLGKKANALPIDEFLACSGTGWYKINQDTYVKELTNGGYTKET